MSIQTIYVYAKSKHALNDALKAGASPVGVMYSMTNEMHAELRACPDGTVVKIYEKVICGNPYAKAYGNVARKKDGSFYVK